MKQNIICSGFSISLAFIIFLACGNPVIKSVDIYLKQGDYEKVVEILDRERSKNPKDGQILLLLAECQGELGHYRELQKILDQEILMAYQYQKRATFIREKYWRINYNRAIDRFSDNELNEAIDFIKNAIIIDSTKAESYSFMGDVFIQLEQPEEAIQAYTRHIELDKKSTISCENLADLNFQNRDFSQAVQLSKEALRRDPTLFSSYMRMAFACQNLDSLDAAEAAYRGAKGLSQSILLFEEYGKLCLRRKKYDLAKEQFAQGLLLSQYDDRFYKYLAECSYGLNDFKNVAAYYEKYITSHTEDFEAIKNLLVAYDRIGDLDNFMRIKSMMERYH
ncbi:tetratricopeptide repeat protein [candidate division KSB1 bacterium]|nr:tetratricopeptide repeat protein [candidate division KSB1 bacterium]